MAIALWAHTYRQAGGEIGEAAHSKMEVTGSTSVKAVFDIYLHSVARERSLMQGSILRSTQHKCTGNADVTDQINTCTCSVSTRMSTNAPTFLQQVGDRELDDVVHAPICQ